MFNRFACLVLKKNCNDLAYLNNHKRIVIVSDGEVELGGVIKKPKNAELHI